MKPLDHPAVPSAQVGVLLVNLGTPEAPEPGAVRRYLAQFLSDRRVIEIPPIFWQPILRGIILTTRPRKSARAYAQVWTDEGSPLAAITQAQTRALQMALGENIRVAYAMRYGEPAIGRAIDALMGRGCRRILVAPLYPQYCAATTATVVDAASAHQASLRWQPTLRFFPPYHDETVYIGALKASVEAGLATLDFAPDILLASFHGMPERTLHLGDPYHCQCQKTARLLSEAIGRPIEVAFQSRFGRAKWLGPATDERLAQFGGEGRSVAVFAPGFSADCLETLEELAIRGREQFEERGGRNFAYLPCLNDSAPGIAMLESLVRREIAGWA